MLGVDTQDASEQGARVPRADEGDVPEPARPRPHVRARFGVTGYPETFLIDRKGRVAALRRLPVTQAWLDQHLPKLLAEKA